MTTGSFAESLRERRRAKNMTQDQLVAESGVSKRFLQELEAGEKAPTIKTLYYLARALDTTPGKLIDPPYECWKKEHEP